MTAKKAGTRSRQALLAERYGRAAEPPCEAALPDDALHPLLTRRSTRTFLDTPVTEEEIALIVGAAQSASTSSNLQAFSFVAVRDPERKARLASLAGRQKHILEAPLLLVVVGDQSRLRALGALTGTPVDGLDYFESYLVTVIDASLAAQNAAVAAHAIGLGTCFIGALRNDPVAVARELALPPESFAVFGLLIGHPDPARATGIKPRLPFEVVLHHEQYRPLDRRAVDDYDAAMLAFQRRQQRPPEDWSHKAAARVAGAHSLDGRDRLYQAMLARGFVMK